MADFSGTDLTGSRPRPIPIDVTGELEELLFTADPQSVTVAYFPKCGSAPPAPPVTHPISANRSGCYRELAGGVIFERILVNPRTVKLGAVISDTQFPVEVWNTFRNIGQILISIDTSGSGDLTVDNTFPLPTFYGAQHARVYQVLVARVGPPQIDEDIDFVWESGEGGADVAVTGSRIVLFSPQVDWNDGVNERISYLTDVLVSYSDAEQRRALRQLARRSLQYRVMALNSPDAAGIESEVWGWQHQPYGVPWWPDARPLLADVAAGGTTVLVDTTNTQFAPGGLACLWSDEFTFEAMGVDAVGSGSLTLSSPLQHTWKAGTLTLVLPVFLCRLPDDVDVERLWSGGDDLVAQFVGEASQVAAAPTDTFTQYRGFDVLEIPPNWVNPLARHYQRSLVHLDPLTGRASVVDKGGSAIVSHLLPWFLDGRAAITKFRAFILRRLGRFKPFWIPTWNQDFTLVQDLTSADTGLRVKFCYYTRFFFPSAARRSVALIPVDRSGNVYRKVLNALDNGDGTETLTLDSPVGKAFSAAQTMVSLLEFVRLANDETNLLWSNTQLAGCDLEIVEVPREVPA